MSNVSRTQRRAGRSHAVVLLVLVSLFAVLVALPQHWRAAGLQAQIDKDQIHLAALRSKWPAALAQEKDSVNQLRDALASLTRRIDEGNPWAPLHAHLSSAMTEAGALEPEISTQPVKHSDEVSVLPIIIQFDGDYQTVWRVLEAIESNERFVRVERLELERDQTVRVAPIHVRLELSAFFFAGSES